MRPALLLLPLALAACATPRETCINDATRNLRVINSLVAETQGNLNRGYAIDAQQELRTIRRSCTVTAADGTRDRVPCDRTDVVNRNVPVAIDLAAERVKLDSLLERQALLERQVQPVLRQCIATYPE